MTPYLLNLTPPFIVIIIYDSDEEEAFYNADGNKYNYTISNAYKINYHDGTIISKRTGKEMRSWNIKGKYMQLELDGKKQLLHRVVWSNYHQTEIPKDVDIHHIDRNPYNNRVKNLEAIHHREHAAIHHRH